jgi:hypothetical protein
MMARLVSAEVGSSRFGEMAPGEPIMLLRRARAIRPVRGFVQGVFLPLMLAMVLVRLAYHPKFGWSTDPVVWFVGISLAVHVLGDRIQAGWFPGIYSLEWSPEGLDARLLWWSDVIPSGTEIAVRFGLIVTAVRSPAGRWYPVPGVVFDRLVEARGGGE